MEASNENFYNRTLDYYYFYKDVGNGQPDREIIQSWWRGDAQFPGPVAPETDDKWNFVDLVRDWRLPPRDRTVKLLGQGAKLKRSEL